MDHTIFKELINNWTNKWLKDDKQWTYNISVKMSNNGNELSKDNGSCKWLKDDTNDHTNDQTMTNNV